MSTGEVAVLGAVAALLGTIIGAAGAILAALAGGRVQLRGQHQQWRREMRRAAYADYLRAAGDYVSAIVVMNVGHLAESEFGADDSERADESAEAVSARDIEDDAYSLLRLEASPAVLSAAVILHATLHHWHRRTRQYWGDPDLLERTVNMTGLAVGDFSSVADFPRGFPAQARYVDARLDEFEAAAKLDLDRAR